MARFKNIKKVFYLQVKKVIKNKSFLPTSKKVEKIQSFLPTSKKVEKNKSFLPTSKKLFIFHTIKLILIKTRKLKNHLK